MAHFFETPEDLPVLLSVEGRRAISYTLTGHFHEPKVRSFSTAGDLPTLYERSATGSAAADHAYLVTEQTTKVLLRELPGKATRGRAALEAHQRSARAMGVEQIGRAHV